MSRVIGSEEDVKIIVRDYLSSVLLNHIVNKGEITIGEGKRWQADITVSENVGVFSGEISMAVECKLNGDLRKTIGQALCYKSVCGVAAVAGVEIEEKYQKVIRESGLYCINITPDSVVETNPEEPTTEKLSVETSEDIGGSGRILVYDMDKLAKNMVCRLAEEMGSVKKGLASELIRRGAKDLAEDTVGVESLEELLEEENE